MRPDLRQIPWRRPALLALVSVAGACAWAPITLRELDWSGAPMAVARCIESFASADAAAARAGVSDAQSSRVPGFPFLRADRFLTSFRDRLEGQAERRAWLGHLGRLDREARRYERMNLPPQAPENLKADRRANQSDRCRSALIEHVLTDEALFGEVIRRTRVADEYRSWQRALGLYPLTGLLVLRGIDRWHAAQYTRSSETAMALSTTGERVFYGIPATPPRAALAAPWQSIADDPLGIPAIDARTLDWLFSRYAPVWAIDTVSPDDRIGMPVWNGRSLAVLTTAPRMYTHASFTRFGPQVLLQLNYTIWFPSRPKTGLLDPLGGKLDGITWRVTLDREGKPLIFDAMHNCGCYHLFFPTQRVRPRSARRRGEEPMWVAQTLGAPLPDPPVIHVAHGTHYLERVDHGPAATPQVALPLAPYSDLRSLPAGGAARRSLFAPDGLVPGTQRLERWILWPMGIPSPGAMRQWGHHATAFVGRRHFDDPDLLSRYFERVEQP